MLAALTAASTLFLVSCGAEEPEATVEDPETTPTQISHDHRIINSVDGSRLYRMETPLLERYELAEEPFMEFREGIKVETFDSLLNIESDIVADYAILNEVTKLWEARGNVIVNNYTGDGRTLLTERLYWDEEKEKIYSDTTSKVIDGSSMHVGQNFEADDSFETWSFHKTVGKIEVDASSMRDTTTVATDPVSDATIRDSVSNIVPDSITSVPSLSDTTSTTPSPIH